MDNGRKELIARMRGIEYGTDVPAKCFTSFKIGGPLAFVAEPASADELMRLLAAARNIEYPVYVIGNGSNLLISDQGIDALFIRLGNRFSGLSVNGDEIIADAGALLSVAAKESVKHGLMGLEWAAGIPGSVGGGAAMNAGAYGGEMKNVIKSVTYVKNGVLFTKNPNDNDFSYRYSAFSYPKSVVVNVRMKLAPDDGFARARMTEYNEKRKRKQPLEYPSAGSAFKRPSGYFAGALIEKAGLKGTRMGNAAVSTKHAGFIINCGGASFDDVIALMDLVREKVYVKFGILLEPEVKIIQ